MSKPLIGTYWMLGDGPSKEGLLNEIPDEWHFARFDSTDVLYICSPWILRGSHQDELGFGFEGGTKDDGWLGIWATRYKWLVAEARTQNPGTRLHLCMMMWYDDKVRHISDLNCLGDDPTKHAKFAAAVKNFLVQKHDQQYANSLGQDVPAHVDGFDIDIENGNIQDYLPSVLRHLRDAFDSIGHLQKFYLSICPFRPSDLTEDCATACDYINMQNYDGGYWYNQQNYLSALQKLKPSQLMWGICSEHPGALNNPECASVDDALRICKDHGLGGVWTWRLNSQNWVYQELLQLNLYAKAKGRTCPDELSELVADGWANGGMDRPEKEGSHTVVAPYNEPAWIMAWRATTLRKSSDH